MTDDPKGKKVLEEISVFEIAFKNKMTDGYRRIIVFDIPEKYKTERDILRGKLREFECEPLQKSVYITPYICEDEIYQIAKALGIGTYVSILKVVEGR